MPWQKPTSFWHSSKFSVVKAVLSNIFHIVAHKENGNICRIPWSLDKRLFLEATSLGGSQRRWSLPHTLVTDLPEHTAAFHSCVPPFSLLRMSTLISVPKGFGRESYQAKACCSAHIEANTIAPAFEKRKGLYWEVHWQGDRRQVSNLSPGSGAWVNLLWVRKNRLVCGSAGRAGFHWRALNYFFCFWTLF